MKNKEIEEMIQNRIEDIYQSGEYIGQAKELEEILEYIKQLQQENEQLKKQKDDVVEYIKTFKDDIRGLDEVVLLRMLGEIDE